ncbi:hypothetical protein J4467_02965 [Candidatus Woesearchaeota archaeon]|nr:hypothetical protein [Candidatus Woesearchaeota archaeon]
MKQWMILVGILLCSFFVCAESTDYKIDEVFVNGIEVDGNLAQVELGNRAQIEVYLSGSGENKDVRVSAWIGGYQYGSVEDVSELFEIEDGVSYRKVLYLEIPDDLDVSSNEYTLHVEIQDSQDRVTKEYTLFLEQEEHKIKVEDVILSSNTIGPGEYLGIKVRLANNGENDEENIRVTASIPDLGISGRVYLDELVSGDQEDVSTIYMTVPSGARAGDYAVEIQVDYGNSESYGAEYLTVLGEARFDDNVYVSISNIKDLYVNEEKTFKVQISNLAGVSKEFSLGISGMDAEVGNSVTIPAGSTGEIYFTLKPEEEGLNNILIVIDSDDGVYQDLYSVNVNPEKSFMGIFLSLFAVLLVVVAIIFFLKKY